MNSRPVNILTVLANTSGIIALIASLFVLIGTINNYPIHLRYVASVIAIIMWPATVVFLRLSRGDYEDGPTGSSLVTEAILVGITVFIICLALNILLGSSIVPPIEEKKLNSANSHKIASTQIPSLVP